MRLPFTQSLIAFHFVKFPCLLSRARALWATMNASPFGFLTFCCGLCAFTHCVGASTPVPTNGTATGKAIDARMFRFPDVSQTQIAFVYAGDIWLAPKTGGFAQRLSSPRGEESFPRF